MCCVNKKYHKKQKLNRKLLYLYVLQTNTDCFKSSLIGAFEILRNKNIRVF